MQHKRIYTGRIIGGLFTVISILLTMTFLVPLYSVLLGAMLSERLGDLYPTYSSKTIGAITLIILAILLLLVLWLFFRYVKQQAKRSVKLPAWPFIGFLCMFYLIIHPLVFYIFLGVRQDFRLDPQFLIDSVVSFPFSSLLFIVLGLWTDWYWNKRKKQKLAS